jgi:hypothetical protein
LEAFFQPPDTQRSEKLPKLMGPLVAAKSAALLSPESIRQE